MARTIVADTQLADGRLLDVAQAGAGDAEVIAGVIVDAFGHRAAVEPRPAALDETAQSVAAALGQGFGVLALVDGEPAGVVIVSIDDPAHGSRAGRAGVHRVSVRPAYQQHGVASVMLRVVGDMLAARGIGEVRLVARAEFPETVEWWRRHGFTEYGREGTEIRLRNSVPIRVEVPTAEDMRALGVRLAALLRAGDVLIASGELGAGKTALAQGIGEGLCVRGPVISPTFVLSRVHPSLAGGPAFVHVDAYRLGSAAELEDIDVDISLDDSVTYIEWGEGIAEGLADERLEVDIQRSLSPDDETRWVFFTPEGPRWESIRAQLEALA